MNILISYLSLYNFASKRLYSTNGLCSTGSITASQTNEPVLRLLASKLEDEGEKLDRIIPILSYKSEKEKCKAVPELTTFEFFKGLAEDILGSDNVIFPVREYCDENTLKETGEVIREICGLITAGDKIYIDTSGGTRTSANMLQLLAKILEYKGYKLAASFYSNINGPSAMIQTTDDFTELTMLADAVNEFVHTGRSYQLSECFKGDTHKDVTELINCMSEFTDRMQLCNTTELDETLTTMRTCIDSVRSIKSDDTKIVILCELLPIIENKFFDGASNSIDYCRMIKWCLENNLIQQAVTIYIEKIPRYIFSNRILICDDEYYNNTKKKNAKDVLKKNTDAIIFYDEFMSSACDVSIRRFQKAMKEKFVEINRDYQYSNDLKEIMFALFKIKKGSRNDFRGYMSKVNTSSLPNISKTQKLVAKYCVDNKVKDFDSMINTFTSQNIPVLYDILNIKQEKLLTIDKKIRTASTITMNNYYQESVTINAKTNINVLRSILFDYIYVKSIRNHINHASDEETLNEQQKDLLERKGCNVREFTPQAISKAILTSVDRIEKAAAAVQ